MSNFMGPMAPPPAAPAQPQALDFQTDPNQRQRFKQFMRQRMQSPMPQMPAPMPQPMPTVPAGSYILPDMDIFAPQQFYDGGIVGGLNNLGEMSGQMVEALNQVVYGGDPMGGGMPSAPSGPPSMGGGGFGGGNMPPPLPAVQQPVMNTEPSGPVANIGSGVSTAQPYNPVGSSAINTSDMYGGGFGADNSMTMGTGLAPAPGDVNSAWQAAVKSAQEQRKNGFMGRVQLPGEGRYEDFVKQYNYNLMNPNQQPLTSVVNDGFGSFTQGPLDFLDGSNIAQPTLGGNVGGDNLMGVLPNGGVTSGQMPPGFTPLPPGELGFTENMMGPFEAYMGGSKYFDESTGLYSGPERLGPEYKFADGGSVPPRETSIRGQYHELSYITPDEADILMALGGSGEPGPMGIPQYGYGDNDGGGYGDGDSDTGGMGSGDSDTGGGFGGGGGGGGNNDGGWDPSDYVGYTEEDEQQQTVDMGNYENDFGGDSPDGYSISDILADNAAAEAAAQEAANRAQLEQAIKSGMVTSAATGQPVMSKSGPVMSGNATPAEKAAAKEAYNQLQSGILGGGIESTGTTGTSNANKADLLGSKFGVTIDDLDIMNMTTPEVEVLANSILGRGFNAAPGTAQANQIGTMPALDSRPSSASATDKTAAAATGLTGKNLDAVVGYDKYGAPVMSGAGYGKNVDLTDQERALGNFMSQTVSGQNRPDRNMLQDIETQMSSAIDRQTLEQSGALDNLGIFADVIPGIGFAKAADEVLGLAEDARKAAFSDRLTDIVGGQYGVTDSETGQLVGTVDPTGGIFGTGTYSGRPGYDPFASGSVFDPETNSYTVTDGSGYDQSGGGDSSVSSGGTPDVPDAPLFPPIFTPGPPPAPVAPGPVLVGSNRQPVPANLQGPVGYGMPQAGQIDPYSLSEMQRYQQMLARLGQAKSPIGLADGGSVLDAAAGRFLESLTAA